MDEYDDSYPTCSETHVSLCLYHATSDPEGASTTLGITPSKSARSGGNDMRPTRRPSSWILSSDDQVDSRDIRRHLDWLLSQLVGNEAGLHQLTDAGWRGVVSCYWMSATGHGGPWITSPQMRALGELGLELQFDIYFDPECV